jgi:imidazolonepropionase
MSTLITHIGQLVVVPPGPVAGPAMRNLRTLADAALLIENGRIAWYGDRSDAPAAADTIDAAGNAVIPGLIDCHTHAIFAGSREREFVQKIEGRAYLDILQSGGGIHSTVGSVRAAGEDELVCAARPRLQRMLDWGVTTVEIKSGYGLTVGDELKMLRAARRLAAEVPQEIVGTWLAAHTIPKEHRDDPDAYLDAVTAPDVFKTLRDEGLSEFCDVFCERGAYDVAQSERYLTACAAAGLRVKVHADQLTQMGASKLAARLGAVSVDHLEMIDDASIEAVRGAGTIPVLLPGCSFFLHSPPADARRLIDAGLPIAIATDVNPGSCMIESLPLVMSMACTMLRMTPAEVLVASTANAAAALNRADRTGAIAIGHRADLIILDVPNYERMMYEVGRNCTATIFAGSAVRTTHS